MKARFYDPEVGLFLSNDPVEGDPSNPPSLHRYLYAFQNPTVYVDPDGQEPISVGTIILLGLLGAEIGFFTDFIIQEVETGATDLKSFVQNDYYAERGALNAVAGAASGGGGGALLNTSARAGFVVAGTLALDTTLDTGIDAALSEEGEFELDESLAKNGAANLIFGGVVSGAGRAWDAGKEFFDGAKTKFSGFFGRFRRADPPSPTTGTLSEAPDGGVRLSLEETADTVIPPKGSTGAPSGGGDVPNPDFGAGRIHSGGVSSAAETPDGPATKRVGRWMSPEELSKMRQTGRLQEGGGGQTRFADPADARAYKNAPEGDVYVEFDVPADRVRPHSQGTSRIPGPNSPDARIPGRSASDFEMPEVTNIQEFRRNGEGGSTP